MSVRIALSSASTLLADALGNPWYELATDETTVFEAPNPFGSSTTITQATIELLDVPGELASHGVKSFDLCNQHVPRIDRTYLKELRMAFEEAGVELFQILIDLGDVSNCAHNQRSASIRLTKRWMEIAGELGALGVRYVPGDSEPSRDTMRWSADALRQLADYARECGLMPAVENYKIMMREADDLLELLALSDREYGLIADFGNAADARRANKYDTLARLIGRATSIHAWCECDADGQIDTADFRRCLHMALATGFDGPIMLLGGRPPDVYRRTRGLWEGVAELGQEVKAVFGADHMD